MPAMTRSPWRDALLLLAVCAIVFWFQLGRIGLIDPDEPFYAQSAREMIAAHDWATPRIFGQPQFEKPILFYVLEAASFRLLGESEGAARVPPALFATLLVLLTYAFGARVLGRRAGGLAALVLATCIATAGTARLVLTDVVFAAFVCGACFALWLAAAAPDRAGRWIVLVFVSTGLAVLTKGPLGALLPALAWLAGGAPVRNAFRGRGRAVALGLGLLALVVVPWFAWMLARFGASYARSFFVHENLDRLLHAEHPANNRIEYYPLVFLIGIVPWLPALGVLLARARGAVATPARRYLVAWLLASLLFLTLAQSKLPTYVYFLFAPLALLIGATIDDLLARGFLGTAERAIAVALALLQAAAFGTILAFPAYRALATPALTAGAVLLAAALALAFGRVGAWATASVAGTATLLVTATTLAAGPVEALLSVRPLAALIRRADPARPVLSSAFLVRGVTYYTGRPPIVLTIRPRPFWTPHPIPVVTGVSELRAFVAAHGTALCAARDREWLAFERRAEGPLGGSRQVAGDKLLVQVSP
jgi:4-amino-4-deoxy-L-arabinose transferase-like glycosyltransferase